MTPSTASAIKTLKQINAEFLAHHVKREDLFWVTYMGVEKDSSKLERATDEMKQYLSHPDRLKEVRASIAARKQEKTGGANEAARAKELFALEGWQSLFSVTRIESELGQKLQSQVIEQEAAIHQKRAELKLHYVDDSQKEIEASTNVLRTHIAASTSETIRKSSHAAMLKLEQWVLASGFIEMIKKRNEFARALGFQNYFEYRVQLNERMSVKELFEILDEFEKLTRDACFRQNELLAKKKGKDAILAHNIRYAFSGDASIQLDPYLPFHAALERWIKSFSRLGIRYRQAVLSLDLLDRKGKYENGFMHGPSPCYFDGEKWNPARINFTSNASPSQVGSGRDGLRTLFHEGGHAAHFSNITLNSPCFSQEYPPTSMAYAETQSMFCDSILNDADWLKLYAKNKKGETVPDDIIRLVLTSDQPARAFSERSILVVPVFEHRLYSMSDDQLTAESITRLARDCEREILGVESPRPLLSIPHLLSNEQACSYQGYLLAQMAVDQTRGYFLKKYGYLTDNPHVGAEISKHYWEPGNSISHNATIQSLTGSRLSGKDLAARCNLDKDELWALAKKQIERVQAARPTTESGTADLDATIKIVHGEKLITDNSKGMKKMWADFEAWVQG